MQMKQVVDAEQQQDQVSKGEAGETAAQDQVLFM